MPRGRRSKKKNRSILDMQVVALIIASILLVTLLVARKKFEYFVRAVEVMFITSSKVICKVVDGFKEKKGKEKLPPIKQIIEKKAEDGTTLTNIRQVCDREQLEELARLLGSDNITEAAISNAAEMRNQALQQKA